MSACDVGDIVQIDGITNAAKYRQVLIHYAIPSGKCLIGFFSITMIPSTLRIPVKSYLERKTADKTLPVMD